MLIEKIKKKESPYDSKSDVALQSSLNECKINIRNAPYFGRGVSLCRKHMLSVKKDNKYRLHNGKDIPNSLELLRYQNGDY